MVVLMLVVVLVVLVLLVVGSIDDVVGSSCGFVVSSVGVGCSSQWYLPSKVREFPCSERL